MNELQLKNKYNLQGTRREIKEEIYLIRQLERKEKVLKMQGVTRDRLKKLILMTGYFDQA